MKHVNPFRASRPNADPPTLEMVVAGILENDALVGELTRRLAWTSPERLTAALLHRLKIQVAIEQATIGERTAARILGQDVRTGKEPR